MLSQENYNCYCLGNTIINKNEIKGSGFNFCYKAKPSFIEIDLFFLIIVDPIICGI